MMPEVISEGTAHTLPTDLREALSSDAKALAAWEDLTPLARNEWICWTISVKTPEKREEHVRRLVSQLKEGKRRPCCWYGCTHRTDKALSPSQEFVLSRKAGKRGTDPDRSSNGPRKESDTASREIDAIIEISG